MQSRIDSCLVFRQDLRFTGENLREELFAIRSGASSGFLGFYLSSKGKFEMFLKVPLQTIFFFFRKRIMNDNIIFYPLIKADFRLKDTLLLKALLDPY